MKVYILKYYDSYDWESLEQIIGIFTKEALDREMEKIISKHIEDWKEEFQEEYEEGLAKALENKIRIKKDIKQLSCEIERLNELLKKSIDDEETYRALKKERKKISRKIHRLSWEAKETPPIVRKYNDYQERIKSNYSIQEIDVIE